MEKIKKLILIILVCLLYSCGVDNVRKTHSTKNTHNVNNEEKNHTDISIEIDSVEEKNDLWIDPTKIDTSITFRDSFLITLKYTDSISINEYFLDKNIIDSLSRPFDNRHLEALVIEEYQIKRFNDFVKRDSIGLLIRLENGNWKRLEIDPKFDEAGNTFEYYFMELGYFSIRVQWYEGNGYKLINSKNGDEHRIWGRPYFSKDNKQMISVIADIDAGYSHNGFQIYSNEFGTLKLIGSFSPKYWGPVSAKWITENKCILKCHTFILEKYSANYFNFFIEIEVKRK